MAGATKPEKDKVSRAVQNEGNGQEQTAVKAGQIVKPSSYEEGIHVSVPAWRCRRGERSFFVPQTQQFSDSIKLV